MYVPVAICLETDTEFHDVFRRLLLSLFEKIRVPETLILNRFVENRQFAFAELISHLAFLRTVPAPTFNTTINIHILD
jgi:hypothetical protein